MAKRVILDTQYTFTPSTKTIVIPRVVQRERLLLITNVTTNAVIYNFSDPALTATSFTIAQGTVTTNPTTTIVLNYNTGNMNATDKLQIVVDEISESFIPDESMIDPVGKMRISSPQALIDTDFEYGLQPTKWETLTLLNMQPSFFVNTQNPITITDIQATNGSATVTVSTTTPPAVGTPVLIQDSLFTGGNGPFLVDSVSAGTNFTYTARTPFTGSSGSVYSSTLTSVFAGSFYSNASMPQATAMTNVGVVVTVTTTNPHGLQVGDGIYVTGSTASSNAPNGAWQVSSVLSSTSFNFVVTSAPTGAISGGTIYPRPDGVYQHRAFDGGVQFTTGNQAHNIQTVRQTRRYFRYQSGKGIQVSTGTILKPNINVDKITSSGTVATVTTKAPHYISFGTTIIISGCNETAYNGTFTVTSVISDNQFTYSTLTTPSATPATGIPTLSVSSWYGATTRTGLFDFQNGVFFEYDGQTLYCVRRSSTTQLSGFFNVTNGSSTVSGATVNGVSPSLSSQLVPGDFIVIRGMSYRVLNIASDTSMTVSPPYRGATLSGSNVCIISKTIDTRVPQNLWNIDKMDGTGPSGMNLDLTKMQMFYLDYSWYGAGTVRYGFRDTQGRVVYVHRFVNNNQNTEAYMRSGNLPARYETNTIAPFTNLAATLASSATTMSVGNTAAFPTSGTVYIDNPSNPEYVFYSGKTATTLTGLTRGKAATTVTMTRTSGSSTLTTTNSVAGLQVGMLIYGTGIPNNTYVASITTGAFNTVVMSRAATSSGSSTYSFANMGNATGDVTHTFSATAPISVYLHSPQFSPTISHWGTSVIMDGQYDNDKSLQFTYGETTTTTAIAGNVASVTISSGSNTFSVVNTTPIFPGMLVAGNNIPAGAIVTAVSGGNPNNTITMNRQGSGSGSATVTYNSAVALATLRVTPSVDSGVTGVLGSKEIVNRMQLTLQNLDVLVNGVFLIQLILNGTPIAPTTSTTTGYTGATSALSTFGPIATGTSSLAQIADHTGPVYVSGGEAMFSFYAVNNAGSTNYSVAAAALNMLRDLGNSILGGGTTNTPGAAGVYPDGPDTLTVVGINIGSSNAQIQTRLSWTEAQA